MASIASIDYRFKFYALIPNPLRCLIITFLDTPTALSLRLCSSFFKNDTELHLKSPTSDVSDCCYVPKIAYPFPNNLCLQSFINLASINRSNFFRNRFNELIIPDYLTNRAESIMCTIILRKTFNFSALSNTKNLKRICVNLIDDLGRSRIYYASNFFPDNIVCEHLLLTLFMQKSWFIWDQVISIKYLTINTIKICINPINNKDIKKDVNKCTFYDLRVLELINTTLEVNEVVQYYNNELLLQIKHDKLIKVLIVDDVEFPTKVEVDVLIFTKPFVYRTNPFRLDRAFKYIFEHLECYHKKRIAEVCIGDVNLLKNYLESFQCTNEYRNTLEELYMFGPLYDESIGSYTNTTYLTNLAECKKCLVSNMKRIVSSNYFDSSFRKWVISISVDRAQGVDLLPIHSHVTYNSSKICEIIIYTCYVTDNIRGVYKEHFSQEQIIKNAISY